MLAVHWSPVKNTRQILRSGIKKSRDGLFCFPLTGNPYVDRWWVKMLRRCRARKRNSYNGFVFRIEQSDLPATYSTFFATAFGGRIESYTSLKKLEALFRGFLYLGVCEHARRQNLNEQPMWNTHEEAVEFGKLVTELDPVQLSLLRSDPYRMLSMFDFLEMVLSVSISPDRILRVISGDKLNGRQQVRKFRQASHESPEW